MTDQTKEILTSRRFILYRDGLRHKASEVDILSFIEDNSFYRDEIREIAKLSFGETRRYGGGASPPMVLERIQHSEKIDCGCNEDSN